MQYALEILPSLLKGASLTLQVFAFVLILSIPLGIVVAFFASIALKDPAWTPNDLYLDHARDPSFASVDLYLLRPSKYWDSD